MKNKLVNRILNYPNIKDKLDLSFIKKLTDAINSFSKRIFSASLNALKYDQVFIENTEVDSLTDMLNAQKLPVEEFQAAFLLTELDWNVSGVLEKTLQFAHKGFCDFFSANDIANMIYAGMRVKLMPKAGRFANIIKNETGYGIHMFCAVCGHLNM